MAEVSFAAVDWEEVLGRLLLHAQNLALALVCSGLKERVLRGGESAADLAHSTLMKFLDPQDSSVKWSEERGQPTTAGVIAYLQKVLTRDFLDLKKSSRYKTSFYPDSEGALEKESEDSEVGMTFDQMAVAFDTPAQLRRCAFPIGHERTDRSAGRF